MYDADESPVKNWSVARILEEMDSGALVGVVGPLTTISVDSKAVPGELRAVGNDGTFFDELD